MARIALFQPQRPECLKQYDQQVAQSRSSVVRLRMCQERSPREGNMRMDQEIVSVFRGFSQSSVVVRVLGFMLSTAGYVAGGTGRRLGQRFGRPPRSGTTNYLQFRDLACT